METIKLADFQKNLHRHIKRKVQLEIRGGVDMAEPLGIWIPVSQVVLNCPKCGEVLQFVNVLNPENRKPEKNVACGKCDFLTKL